MLLMVNRLDLDHYKMLCLYSVDLNTARHTLARLVEVRRVLGDEATSEGVRGLLEGMQHPLFRDSVVAYTRPFSANQSGSGKKHLPVDCVPAEHRPKHDALMELRNQLIAHSDERFHRVGLMFAFGGIINTFKGGGVLEPWLNFLPEVDALMEAVENEINARRDERSRDPDLLEHVKKSTGLSLGGVEFGRNPWDPPSATSSLGQSFS